ncbi:MAG TPA: ABC transporter substrate-binding protein [Anaerolineae bacterium]|nr:ABC transporter substrate-binding protein [Anaerolineae bacterium]
MNKVFTLAVLTIVLAALAAGCAGGAQPTLAPTNAPAPQPTTGAPSQPTVGAPAQPTQAPNESSALPKWIKWHDPAAEADELFNKANGTGPYKLVKWTPGESVEFVRNDDYWLKQPAWEGGPSGPAQIAHAIIKEIDEWGTRFAAFQAGDGDYVTVNPEFWPQVDAISSKDCDAATGECKPFTGTAKIDRYRGLAQTSATDVLMNANINTAGGNNYIGSGALDGNGIPPDFFNDVHVHKAFNYCFDWDTYIKDVWQGEAEQRNGAVINPMLGYNPQGPHYSLDLDKCAEEFKASTWKSADGKSLWDTGFYMQLTFNSGNTSRQIIDEIIKTNVEKVNPNFKIEVYALPWPVFLKERTAQKFPVYTIGWGEDYHDPHNWVVPYLASYGTYGSGVPKDLQPQMDEMIAKAAAETDPKKREQLYFDIQKFTYDNAIHIWLAQGLTRRYYQDWVTGIYYNPSYSDQWFYQYSKKPDAKNPDTFIYLNFGDAESLDPNWSYESFGGGVIQNIYDPLVWFKKDSITEFVPWLAEKWDISPDGKTYTFTIRKGVKFHEGQELKASDIAYTLQRGLLQDRTDGPQNLYMQPLFGVPSIKDLAAKEAGLNETPANIQDIPAEGLIAACKDVQNAIKADDTNNTVTMTLNRPFAPWINLMAGYWSVGMSKEWVIAQGGWDGTCD